MKILITGGAGYIGNVLIQKLFAATSQMQALSPYDKLVLSVSHEKGYDEESHLLGPDIKITVYDNLKYKQLCLTEHCYHRDGGFNFVHGDVRDHKKLLPYIKEADVIFPLAAIVGAPACEKDPQEAHDVNFEHIKFIVENTSPEQKIIYPNTNSGYGLGQGEMECTEKSPLNPISVYGKTKCMAEDVVLQKNKGVVLRLATVFGSSPRMRLDLLVNDFVYRAITDSYIVLFEKDFKRNYIHIHDVALTMISMINNYDKRVGEAYNVGLSSANLSKLELCEKIKGYIPNFVIKYDDFKEDPDKRNYIVSNDKLEKTGWKPYYTLDDGIQELIQAYRIIDYINKPFTNL